MRIRKFRIVNEGDGETPSKPAGIIAVPRIMCERCGYTFFTQWKPGDEFIRLLHGRDMGCKNNGRIFELPIASLRLMEE